MRFFRETKIRRKLITIREIFLSINMHNSLLIRRLNREVSLNKRGIRGMVLEV